MKTKVVKIEREFEVGDTFLFADGKVEVVKRIDDEAQEVLFHDSFMSVGQFSWLNQLLDDEEITYMGKVIRVGNHPVVDV